MDTCFKQTHTLSPMGKELKLGEILVGRGVIAQRYINQAMALKTERNSKLGEVLIDEKLVSKFEVEQALQEQYWRRQGQGWNKPFLASLWQSVA